MMRRRMRRRRRWRWRWRWRMLLMELMLILYFCQENQMRHDLDRLSFLDLNLQWEERMFCRECVALAFALSSLLPMEMR
jgi:hypothetical protein